MLERDEVVNELPVAMAVPPVSVENQETVPPVDGTADNVTDPVPHLSTAFSETKPAVQVGEETESVYCPMLP